MQTPPGHIDVKTTTSNINVLSGDDTGDRTPPKSPSRPNRSHDRTQNPLVSQEHDHKNS